MKLCSVKSQQAVLATLCALVLTAGTPGGVEAASITVQADQPGIKVSPTLYGIFFEEINCAGDGGLYAELVRNRSFEDSDKPTSWELETKNGATGEMSVVDSASGEAYNQRALQVKIQAAGGAVSIVNSGYWGIAVKAGETYNVSLRAKGGDGFAGPLKVSLQNAFAVLASKQIDKVGSAWQTFNFTLVPAVDETSAHLVISTGQSGVLNLDMVSLFPAKTFKGRKNGLRVDLAEKLQGLKPAFVRFPGGCWVEGDRMNLAYRWKETIGPVSNRRTQHNIWQYESTQGLGYHEYLQLCEDLKADPLFVINVGMSHKENVPMGELAEYVQDALDAIEYANGPVTSQWGSQRARNGHAKPFNLQYMEIGNENGGPAYHERYARFYDAIKAKYPDMKLVANVWGGTPTNRPAEIVDEHYYSNPNFFIQNANKYDSYSRTGPKVYVGEYAVTEHCGQGNLMGAIGEAAFMTGMERNSDVVIMSSYAPLFANVNYKKWNPDLIDFDSSRSYGIPSYYVQKMFAENRGDHVLPTTVEAVDFISKPGATKGGIGLATWDTQAEYKDIKVEQDGKVLFAEDFSSGAGKWNVRRGDWKVMDGAYRQSGEGSDQRTIVGDASWTDYTFTCKARKISGAEGFMVLFHAIDDSHWSWWNVGGWGNTQHAIERAEDGGKYTVGASTSGSVETGRWYDLKVELKGNRIRCYLDGKLIHDVEPKDEHIKPLQAVAGTAPGKKEVILKVVNVSGEAQTTDINLRGVKGVGAKAALSVLSGEPKDENTLENPTKVATVQKTIDIASPQFSHTFPPYSVSVIRVPVK